MTKQKATPNEPIFERNVSEPAFRVIQKGSGPSGYTMTNGARHLIVKRESAQTLSVRLKVYRKPNSPEVNDETFLTNEEYLTAMGMAEVPTTDPKFAKEMGAEVGIRNKFARKGEITNFYYFIDGQSYWITVETTPSLKMKAKRFVEAGAPIAK